MLKKSHFASDLVFACNAQEGPGPISAGPISKSINANQLLT